MNVPLVPFRSSFPLRVGTWLGLAALLVAGLRLRTFLSAEDAAVVATPSWPQELASPVGPQACAECHVDEFTVWEASSHQYESRTLTRDPQAKEIATRLGVRRIKSDERCARCHFTLQHKQNGRSRAIAGVSCESCHGPAAQWMDIHADFGPGCSDSREETPEHREQRLAACDAAGMVRPAKLDSLARRCFECHWITDRDLIEAGGHPDGRGFELVSWSQGEIRHNFVAPSRSDVRNEEAPLERRAAMYLMGRVLELEFALRAYAERGSEADREAVRLALGHLEAIDARIELPALTEWIEGIPDPPVPAQGLAATVARELDALTTVSKADLRKLEPLLPAPGEYRGRAHE